MSFRIATYLPATTGILAPPFTPNPYGKVEAPQLGVHPAYKNFCRGISTCRIQLILQT